MEVCTYHILFSFRFKGFCVSTMLISLAFTTLRKFLRKKKQQNQTAVVPTQEMSSSVAIVELPFNVVSENDQMISFNTVVIFSSVSFFFIMIWIVYSSYSSGLLYYNLIICFSLVLNITPPLYFFKKVSNFKIAISVVREMFNWFIKE